MILWWTVVTARNLNLSTTAQRNTSSIDCRLTLVVGCKVFKLPTSFLLCILGETGLTMGLMTSRRSHQECITKTKSLIRLFTAPEFDRLTQMPLRELIMYGTLVQKWHMVAVWTMIRTTWWCVVLWELVLGEFCVVRILVATKNSGQLGEELYAGRR